MKKELSRLVSGFSFLLGGEVKKVFLIIWPSENGLIETDTKIFFSLLLPTTHEIDIILGTDTDGQTPVIEYAKVESKYCFSSIEERLLVWQQKAFWEEKQSPGPEIFDLSKSKQFSNLFLSKLNEINIYYFPEEQSPTGVRLVFSPEIEIWSVPGAWGNRILTEYLDTNFDFPVKKITLIFSSNNPTQFQNLPQA